MKLQHKLMIIFILALTLSIGISGFITLQIAKTSNLSTAESSYRHQLDSVALAFEQATYRHELTGLSDVVRQSFLKFQFQQSCGEGYVLMQNDESISNLTAYEIVNPNLLLSNYQIQQVNGREIMLLKKELRFPENSYIISVQDITSLYDSFKRQIFFFLAVYIIGMAVAGTAVTLSIKKLLAPFAALKTAADELSSGKMDSRAVINTRDEIGEVGKAFNHMAEKIEHQIDDLKLLLGALSHEIKTPITSIVGYAYSLLYVDLPKTERELALDYIYHEGKRLDYLSAKMMSLLGYYENDAIEKNWVGISDLFNSIQKIESDYLDAHQVTLSTEPDPNMAVYGDQTLLESLISNLIHNAVKASQPESTIILRATTKGIEVEDSGCGILQSEIDNITKAFYMINKSRSRSEGGAGLGLAICKQIVQLHEAELEINSQVNKGTLVRVSFPDVYKTFTFR